MKFLCLLFAGMFSMMIVSCSDDDDASDDGTSSGEFTPGGQFTTNNGSVYLIYAAYYRFEYTDGDVTSVYQYDRSNNEVTDDVEDSYTVTHDPLSFIGTHIQLTDIEQNDDGFITSLTKIDSENDAEINFTFSYDSSGHLTSLKEEGDYNGATVDGEWTLTWSNNKITKVTQNYYYSDYTCSLSSIEDIEYLSSIEYSSDYPNVTLQYGPYVENMCGSKENGLEMLFYLGYLGKASSYHPLSYCLGEADDDEEPYEYYYYCTPTLNSDGSLKEVEYEDYYTYTFSYQ